MCSLAVSNEPLMLKYIPDEQKTQEMRNSVVANEEP